DRSDQREDEVRLTEMRPGEPRRPHDLADDDRGRDAGEHEHGKDVGDVAIPERRVLSSARDVDRGEDDRREEDDEAPEDERVHEPRHEPLEELALAEDDLRLGGHARGHIARPVGRPRACDDPRQEERTAREDPAGDEDERREPDRAYPRTLRSSALIAGTTSCRSPITAESALAKIGASGSVLMARIF